MKTYAKLVFFLLTIGCLAACQEEPLTVQGSLSPNATTGNSIQLLQDSSITDTTKSWLYNFEGSNLLNPNGYVHSLSKEHSVSAPYALKLSCSTVKEPGYFCYWGQTLVAPRIPAGKKLTLKAKVRLENVIGQGVSLAIREDRVDQGTRNTVLFKYTEGIVPIRSTGDFKEYSLETDSYPGHIDYLVVFLIYLPGTTGTVYFDEVTLTAH